MVLYFSDDIGSLELKDLGCSLKASCKQEARWPVPRARVVCLQEAPQGPARFRRSGVLLFKGIEPELPHTYSRARPLSRSRMPRQVCRPVFCPFVLLESVLWSLHTPVYSFMLLVMDVWVAAQPGLMVEELLGTFLYKSFSRRVFLCLGEAPTCRAAGSQGRSVLALIGSGRQFSCAPGRCAARSSGSTFSGTFDNVRLGSAPLPGVKSSDGRCHLHFSEDGFDYTRLCAYSPSV